MVWAGNITISSKPKDSELRSGVICGYCMSECDEVPSNDSFSDSFGEVTCYGITSSCCDSECFEGRILLDKVSCHTARKDDPKHGIKAGDRYRSEIKKGYYIEDGKHHPIFRYKKFKVNPMSV